MNHASARYFERYGKRLTVQMYQYFVAKVKSGESVPLLANGGNRVVHDVEGVILVYRKKAGEIITFLPPSSREEMMVNEKYRKYLDWVEGGGINVPS